MARVVRHEAPIGVHERTSRGRSAPARSAAGRGVDGCPVSDEPVADVVAYVHGTVGHAWCGWCRQWHRHGSAWQLPAVRPSGCSAKRNPACPTRDDAPVMVWPVPVREEPRCTGDGRLGGKLPVSDEGRDNSVTVVPAGLGMIAMPKALVRLARTASAGPWNVRVQSARFTWTERTGRIADVVLARFDCRCNHQLRVCYVDSKFESCYSNRLGRLPGNGIRRAITECEADA